MMLCLCQFGRIRTGRCRGRRIGKGGSFLLEDSFHSVLLCDMRQNLRRHHVKRSIRVKVGVNVYRVGFNGACTGIRATAARRARTRASLSLHLRPFVDRRLKRARVCGRCLSSVGLSCGCLFLSISSRTGSRGVKWSWSRSNRDGIGRNSRLVGSRLGHSLFHQFQHGIRRVRDSWMRKRRHGLMEGGLRRRGSDCIGSRFIGSRRSCSSSVVGAVAASTVRVRSLQGEPSSWYMLPLQTLLLRLKQSATRQDRPTKV
mmetsp:Transcript_17923/g.36732  ORF Transcript_17923/g.36732 Transcript_17923/m.36732 type:complete len:258 (+) Transcript_17923:2094-2867(+)